MKARSRDARNESRFEHCTELFVLPGTKHNIMPSLRKENRSIYFPCSADHEQDWEPYGLNPNLL